MELIHTHKSFQAQIKELATKYQTSPFRLYEWWVKYNDSARTFGQSAILWEFEQWYKAKMAAIANNHPRYAEMKTWPPKKIKEHLASCEGTRPDGLCVPGQGALSTAEHNEEHERWKIKCTQHKSTVSGTTRNPRDVFACALGIIVGTHDEFGKRKA